MLDPMQHLLHPPCAFAALRALAASLFGVESRGPKRQPDHAGGFINDHHAAGAQKSSLRRERIEIHPNVALFRAKNRDRRAARNDTLQLVAVANSAALV